MGMDRGQDGPGADGEGVSRRVVPPGPEATELDQLKEELAEAARERGQFRSLLQSVQADFVHYRKRTEAEQGGSRDAASGQLLLRLLPVLDDLDRALSSGPGASPEAEAGWMEGVRLIDRKFHAVLAAEGLERMAPEGAAFDPRDHEVVSYTEAAQQAPGVVTAVVRSGYRLGGKVLRPALVVVARVPEGPGRC